jgi:hypothetical protein
VWGQTSLRFHVGPAHGQRRGRASMRPCRAGRRPGPRVSAPATRAAARVGRNRTGSAWDAVGPGGPAGTWAPRVCGSEAAVWLVGFNDGGPDEGFTGSSVHTILPGMFSSGFGWLLPCPVIFEGVFAINFTRSNVLFFLLLRKQDDKMYALFPSLQLGQVLPRMAPQLLFFSSPGVIFQGGTKPSTVT